MNTPGDHWREQAAPYRPAEPRRDPLVYAVASFFVPGLGTIINGQVRRGVTIMAIHYGTPFAVLAILFFTLFTTRVDLSPVNLAVILGALAVMFGTGIWGIVDAYRAASEHNRLHVDV